jgi:lipoprotein-releasing system permease protein
MLAFLWAVSQLERHAALAVSRQRRAAACGLMPAMFRPLESFIGLRYLWSRRYPWAVSFRSAASMLGIGFGVAALIVVLSVMNGLESEARDRLLSLTAHATLSDPPAGLEDWSALAQQLRAYPGLTGAAPYTTLEGMLSAGAKLHPAIVRGVLPEVEEEASHIADLVEFGSLDSLSGPTDAILVGRAIASNLGVSVGDHINLLYARVVDGQPRPGLVSLVVGGIFSAGIAEHDSTLALVHLDFASRLSGIGHRAQALGIRVQDPLAVENLKRWIMSNPALARFRYTDWTEQHRSHFRAIRIEKTMMTIILLLIVAIAAFNIVASLMMIVTDKTKDIAIMRTFGLEANRVARIFLYQGSIIGVVGIIVGVTLGVWLALNIEVIVPWLEATFGFKIMPGDVYYVTELPSELHATDVALTSLFAFLIALAATFYPSRRAATITPAEALRYD